MRVFGYEVRTRNVRESRTDVHRLEFSAPDHQTAQAWLTGWAGVTGREIIDWELIADGCTFREQAARDLSAMAERIAPAYNAAMVEPVHSGEYIVGKMWLPNGWGVSVSSKISENHWVRSEFVTIREDPTDRHGFAIDFPLPEFPVAGGAAPENPEADGEIRRVLDLLSKLPPVFPEA
jgi:hypothetical protein